MDDQTETYYDNFGNPRSPRWNPGQPTNTEADARAFCDCRNGDTTCKTGAAPGYWVDFSVGGLSDTSQGTTKCGVWKVDAWEDRENVLPSKWVEFTGACNSGPSATAELPVLNTYWQHPNRNANGIFPDIGEAARSEHRGGHTWSWPAVDPVGSCDEHCYLRDPPFGWSNKNGINLATSGGFQPIRRRASDAADAENLTAFELSEKEANLEYRNLLSYNPWKSKTDSPTPRSVGRRLLYSYEYNYDQRADDGGFSYGDVEEPTLRFGDQSRPWELADSEGIPSWAGPLQSGLRTYGVDAPSGPVRTNVKDDDDDDGFGHAFDVNSDPLTGGGPGKLPRGTSIDDYNAWKAAGGVPIGGDKKTGLMQCATCPKRRECWKHACCRQGWDMYKTATSPMERAAFLRRRDQEAVGYLLANTWTNRWTPSTNDGRKRYYHAVGYGHPDLTFFVGSTWASGVYNNYGPVDWVNHGRADMWDRSTELAALGYSNTQNPLEAPSGSMQETQFYCMRDQPGVSGNVLEKGWDVYWDLLGNASVGFPGDNCDEYEDDPNDRAVDIGTRDAVMLPGRRLEEEPEPEAKPEAERGRKLRHTTGTPSTPAPECYDTGSTFGKGASLKRISVGSGVLSQSDHDAGKFYCGKVPLNVCSEYAERTPNDPRFFYEDPANPHTSTDNFAYNLLATDYPDPDTMTDYFVRQCGVTSDNKCRFTSDSGWRRHDGTYSGTQGHGGATANVHDCRGKAGAVNEETPTYYQCYGIHANAIGGAAANKVWTTSQMSGSIAWKTQFVGAQYFYGGGTLADSLSGNTCYVPGSELLAANNFEPQFNGPCCFLDDGTTPADCMVCETGTEWPNQASGTCVLRSTGFTDGLGSGWRATQFEHFLTGRRLQEGAERADRESNKPDLHPPEARIAFGGTELVALPYEERFGQGPPSNNMAIKKHMAQQFTKAAQARNVVGKDQIGLARAVRAKFDLPFDAALAEGYVSCNATVRNETRSASCAFQRQRYGDPVTMAIVHHIAEVQFWDIPGRPPAAQEGAEVLTAVLAAAFPDGNATNGSGYGNLFGGIGDMQVVTAPVLDVTPITPAPPPDAPPTAPPASPPRASAASTASTGSTAFRRHRPCHRRRRRPRPDRPNRQTCRRLRRPRRRRRRHRSRRLHPRPYHRRRRLRCRRRRHGRCSRQCPRAPRSRRRRRRNRPAARPRHCHHRRRRRRRRSAKTRATTGPPPSG